MLELMTLAAVAAYASEETIVTRRAVVFTFLIKA